MSDAVMFRDLPATFPEKDKYKKTSVVSSMAVHVALIVLLVLVPLVMPQQIEQWELLATLVAPLSPPPAPAPPPVETVARPPEPVVQKVLIPEPDTMIMPTVIPKEIARIVDEPLAASGFIGGVPGGVRGGAIGGILGGILAAQQNDIAPAPPPPPPPPPKPASPIRVGGNVKEPRIVKLVQPVYPPLASRARVSGTVVLEATLTTEGTVDEIHVISGHPLLVEAALECVKQWLYEPTYLNGTPVAVILTAKVSFHQKPISYE